MAITWTDKKGRVRITHLASGADQDEVIERLRDTYSLVPGHRFHSVDDGILYTRIAELGGNSTRYPQAVKPGDYNSDGSPSDDRIARFRWSLDGAGLPIMRS
jgi:hypothetical protein